MATSITGHADDTDLGITGQQVGTAPVDIGSSFIFEVQPSNYGSVISGSVDIILDLSSYTGSGSVSITAASSSASYSCTGMPNTAVTCTLNAGLNSGSHTNLAETLSFTVANSSAVDGDNIPLDYSILHTDIDAEVANDSGLVTITVEDAGALDFCYAVADSNNSLIKTRRDGSGSPTTVGNFGGSITSIEAIAFVPKPSGLELYATNEDDLGTLDFNGTGAFTAIGAGSAGTIGVDNDAGGSSDGNVTLNDIDGLSFHSQTLDLWATDREGGDDILFKINYETTTVNGTAAGDAFNDTFGGGTYGGVRILSEACPTTVSGIGDSEDLAINAAGEFYVQIDSIGTEQQLAILELGNDGLPTGNLSRCHFLVNASDVRVEDMEGTGFDQDGILWGTTGNSSSLPSNSNRLWTVDITPRAIGNQVFLDDFSTDDYSGNQGGYFFFGDWVEDDDGNNNGGDIFVSSSGNCTSGDCLEVESDHTGEGIYREFSLLGLTTATLTFDYFQDDLSTGVIELEISDDGGSNYTTLDTFTGSSANGSKSYDLHSIGAIFPFTDDMRVRFNVPTGGPNNRELFIDNFTITPNTLSDSDCEGSNYNFSHVCAFEATEVKDLTSVGGDYEATDCRVASLNNTNHINGTVWTDDNGDSMYNFATENIGQSNVTVNLYQDTDNNSTINAGDILIQTTVTDVNGEYNFNVASSGDYLVDIITGGLPSDTVLTTDNVEVINFGGLGLTENNNDFGFVINTDYGDAPSSYGDAAHIITSTLFIGSVPPDPESSTADSILSDGDDASLPTSDEDGISFSSLTGGGVQATVLVSNDTGNNAFICAWLDRWDGTGNGNGDFDASDAEDGGVICQTVADNNLTPAPYTFDWLGASLPDVAGFTYARFRVCSTLSECNLPINSSSPTTVSETNSSVQAINDNACFDKTFTFSESFNLTAITVEVDIDHTWRADLELTLTSPSATTVDLSSDNGGSADDLIAVFDDAAVTSIVGDNTNHSSPAVDRIPEASLSAFHGENLNGLWELEVCDDAGLDQGTFNSATLNISGLDGSSQATSGEVEDHRIDFDFTPTAVTVGDVNLNAIPVDEFLNSLGVSQMNVNDLLKLLSVFSPETAQSIASVDTQTILDALAAFLDPDGDGQIALLKWETLEERGTIGFYVKRQQLDGSWVAINSEMLPSLNFAPMGGEYMMADPGAVSGTTYRYRLVEQEASGNTQNYGPFVLEMR